MRVDSINTEISTKTLYELNHFPYRELELNNNNIKEILKLWKVQIENHPYSSLLSNPYYVFIFEALTLSKIDCKTSLLKKAPKKILKYFTVNENITPELYRWLYWKQGFKTPLASFAQLFDHEDILKDLLQQNDKIACYIAYNPSPKLDQYIPWLIDNKGDNTRIILLGSNHTLTDEQLTRLTKDPSPLVRLATIDRALNYPSLLDNLLRDSNSAVRQHALQQAVHDMKTISDDTLQWLVDNETEASNKNTLYKFMYPHLTESMIKSMAQK